MIVRKIGKKSRKSPATKSIPKIIALFFGKFK